MAMTEKEKMIAGLSYNPADPELTKGRIRARILFQKFNKLDLPSNVIMVITYQLVITFTQILIV